MVLILRFALLLSFWVEKQSHLIYNWETAQGEKKQETRARLRVSDLMLLCTKFHLAHVKSFKILTGEKETKRERD